MRLTKQNGAKFPNRETKAAQRRPPAHPMKNLAFGSLGNAKEQHPVAGRSSGDRSPDTLISTQKCILCTTESLCKAFGECIQETGGF